MQQQDLIEEIEGNGIGNALALVEGNGIRNTIVRDAWLRADAALKQLEALTIGSAGIPFQVTVSQSDVVFNADNGVEWLLAKAIEQNDLPEELDGAILEYEVVGAVREDAFRGLVIEGVIAVSGGVE